MSEKEIREMSIDELQEKKIVKKAEPISNGEQTNKDFLDNLNKGLDGVIERTKEDAIHLQNANQEADLNEEEESGFDPINPLDFDGEKKENKSDSKKSEVKPRPALDEEDPDFIRKFEKLKEKIAKDNEEKQRKYDEEHPEVKVQKELKEDISDKLSNTTLSPSSSTAKDKVSKELNEIEEEESEESNTDDDIKEFKELQTTIKNKLKPVDNIIDLESYEVAGYTASTSTVLSKVDSRHKVDWLLYAGKCPISFIDFKADEIERLDPRTSSENSLNTLNSIYKLIYDHLIFRTNKRPEFDQWLKSVKYYDVDNLYYGIILASFGKILTLPLNCPHCKKPFVKDVPTDDLVKYFNDSIRKKAKEIYETASFHEPRYEIVRKQITDDIVIDIQEPSLYNMVFVPEKLSDEFKNRYSRVMAAYPYIYNMYVINRENHKLEPIVDENKKYDDPLKEIRIRIKKFGLLIGLLNSDQYYLLNTYINKISEPYESELTYQIPAMKCPKCGKDIDAQPSSAASLLFMRHRLMNLLSLNTK